MKALKLQAEVVLLSPLEEKPSGSEDAPLPSPAAGALRRVSQGRQGQTDERQLHTPQTPAVTPVPTHPEA